MTEPPWLPVAPKTVMSFDMVSVCNFDRLMFQRGFDNRCEYNARMGRLTMQNGFNAVE